mmetsp:Transcript_20005/g.37171  ORF Transcript_20005/g.37171 Transcript_20005/m.37171 type:complete len:235 (-) Transcript_20005:4773-5477(-)
MGFENDRFSALVDDFFVCKACSTVVQNPVECSTCENLSCSLCAAKCLHCGSEEFKTPAKFVRLVYAKLSLKCINSHNGCAFEGLVSEVEGHEAECLHVYISCESPICDRTILKSNRREGPNGSSVCSNMCRSILAFKQHLASSGELELLHLVKQAVLDSKEDLMEEVQAELEHKQAELRDKEEALKQLESQMDGMKKELDARRRFHHSGKWNFSHNKWSCCGVEDKSGLGCIKL